MHAQRWAMMIRECACSQTLPQPIILFAFIRSYDLHCLVRLRRLDIQVLQSVWMHMFAFYPIPVERIGLL